MGDLTAADRDRIEGREWAEEVIADVLENTDDFIEGFERQIRRVYRMFRTHLTDQGAMTHKEAIEFEKEQVGFGCYTARTYATTPPEYLAWLVDANLDLARYVRSERFQEATQGRNARLPEQACSGGHFRKQSQTGLLTPTAPSAAPNDYQRRHPDARN